ncbi:MULTISPECIES: hypothetical protein [Ochrobactrum]|uniref:DUF2125 domain-containing protein n=1 Tax=Ochrobactrum chromiisoli TaxID=2993941 RepID=A0ABT3QK13_9HYPH|nr:hypothetical protein [Ochrobactrum chromiisoli]MCX2695942.1 hypothetical protein [Ochrobactrum chromiisoli]
MRFILPAVLLSLASTSAFAQKAAPAPENAPLNRCEEFLNGMSLLTPGKDYAVRDIPDGCIVSNSVYHTMRIMGWTIDRAILEADRLQDYLSEAPDLSKAAPQWGRIAVDGVRMTLQSGNKVSDYITSIQQWPMDFTASYRFNPQSGYLHIQNAEISSLKIGKASVSAQINLPVDSSVASLTVNPTATLSHLRLRLDNQGLWESIALPVLANYAALPSETGESDPEADIARLRDVASKGIEMLPDSQINADSRKALLRFVADMPHPTGFFTMDVDFDKPLPISLNDLEPDTLAQHALTGAKISVTYKAR